MKRNRCCDNLNYLSMKYILKKYLITTISIFVVSKICPAFLINRGWVGLFYSSFILSLLMYIAKPVINLLMLPINIITLNMTAWILNILIIYLWSIILSEVSFTIWEFSGINLGIVNIVPITFLPWQTAIIISIIMIIILRFAEWVLK